MIISKVSISKEAKADYLDMFETEMSEKISKNLVNDIFIFVQINGTTKNKFKIKYLDEDKNCMIYVFVIKTCESATSFLNVVYWNIAGICHESEIIKELEEEGIINIWLKSYLL